MWGSPGSTPIKPEQERNEVATSFMKDYDLPAELLFMFALFAWSKHRNDFAHSVWDVRLHSINYKSNLLLFWKQTKTMKNGVQNLDLLGYAQCFSLWSFDKVYSTAAAFLPIIYMRIFIALSSLLLLKLCRTVPVISVLLQCCILVWQANAKVVLNTYMEQTG